MAKTNIQSTEINTPPPKTPPKKKSGKPAASQPQSEKETDNARWYCRGYAKNLDREDGKLDGKIDKSIWNPFASKFQIKQTNKAFVTVDEAIGDLLEIVDNVSDELTNEANHRFGHTPVRGGGGIKEAPKRPQKQTKPKTAGTGLLKWGGKILAALTNNMNTSSGTLGPVYSPVTYTIRQSSANKLGHLLDDPDKFVSQNSNASVQEALRRGAGMSESFTPLASKLLRLSVTPSEMTVGRHSGYTVLNLQQSKTKLGQLYMREGDINAYGYRINHLTSEKMKYNTVVFDAKSKEAQIVSKESDLREAVKWWIKNGAYKVQYLGGILNDKKDTQLSINQCIFAGMSCKDNGNSYTVSGYIEDVYDFDENECGYGGYTGTTEDLNHIGALAQKKGALKPYRILIPFTLNIPKSELNAKKK